MTDENTPKSAAARKAEQRLRDAQKGIVTVSVKLGAADARTLARCKKKQKGPQEGFEARALVIGAKFLANAGQPVGAKMKGGQDDQ